MATSLETQPATKIPPYTKPAIPFLENGDRLTRTEFYARWEAMPQLKKAERIEGEVYMHAAVRYEQHGHPHFWLANWLGHYEAFTPVVQGGDNTTLQLDPDNDPQPDCFLRIKPQYGGQSSTTDKGYVSGAPELVAEVAASSASYDLHKKLHVYRRNGVCEYLVWKVLEDEVVWFELQEDTYVEVHPDENGVFKSVSFPGLWLDSKALIGGELAKVLATLQQGIEADNHKRFVEKLQSAPPQQG